MGWGLWALCGFALACAGVLGLFARMVNSKGDRLFREGTVTGVTGRKGHGKSLLLTHEQLRHIGRLHRCKKCSRYLGRKVFHEGRVASNGTLLLPENQRHLHHQVTGWGELMALVVDERRPPTEADGDTSKWYQTSSGEWVDPAHHCTLIVLDEVHMENWAPARQGEQLHPMVQFVLAQIRKYVGEMIWCAQHQDRVSLGLRRQTDELAVCRKGYFGAMKVHYYEPEDVTKRDGKPTWTYRYRVSKRLAAAYNTYELIKPAETITEDVASTVQARRAAAVPEARGVAAARASRPMRSVGGPIGKTASERS